MPDTDNGNSSGPGWMNDVQRILALVIVGVFALALLLMAFRVTIWGAPDDTLDLLKTLVSALINVVMLVLGYFYGSSKAKEQSDTSQQKIVEKLTSTEPPGGSGPVAPVPATVVVIPWWSKLTPEEQAVIGDAAHTDPKAAVFMAAAQTGSATAEDIAYLVSKNLLTQERATAIQA